MNKFSLIAFASVFIGLTSSAAQATNIEVTVSETGKSGISQVVASWTQNQNPTPLEFIKDYYTTVPVFNAVGIGGDTAITWYSNTNGQFGGFTNFGEEFNVLAPASYAFTESSPTFVPGKYVGVNLRQDLTYIPTSYTITLLPDALPKLSRFKPQTVVDPVPEPATWAMMIVGLGLIGFVARRRNVSVTYA